jgi:hypothetical protein
MSYSSRLWGEGTGGGRFGSAGLWLLAWVVVGGCFLIGGTLAGPRAGAGVAPAPAASGGPRSRAIEEMRRGDWVLARDPATGSLGPRRVVKAFRRTAYHLRVLRVRSGGRAVQELRTTDEHPFWVPSRGWVPAGELAPGDRLTQDGGRRGTVLTTAREPHPEGVPVFNLKVEGLHNYFAAGQRGSHFLLVHNADCLPGGSPAGGIPKPAV